MFEEEKNVRQTRICIKYNIFAVKFTLFVTYFFNILCNIFFMQKSSQLFFYYSFRLIIKKTLLTKKIFSKWKELFVFITQWNLICEFSHEFYIFLYSVDKMKYQKYLEE